MGRLVDTNELIDAQGVTYLLGLAQRNTVSFYQWRYSEMPKLVINLGKGRCKMWLRSEMTAWSAHRMQS